MEPAVGQVRSVWVNINRLDPSAGRKSRPGVLVAPGRVAGHWVVMGLTTLATYGDGIEREPLLEWRLSGLRRPSFLWSRRPVVLPTKDVGSYFGIISVHDAATICSMFGEALTVDQAAAFTDAAIEFPLNLVDDPFAGLCT